MSTLPPEHRNLIPGYELIRKLGQGGMGAVFQARQISMDRMVALKVLPRNLAKQEKFKERFFREARAAGRLNHPNIVQALDAQEAGGYSYLAMELVEGVSLQKHIRENGRLPEKETLHVIRQIADALDHAWTQHHVVHRDIKPENILYTPDRTAKLCDMGIARINTDAAMTQEGATIGTPSYISPEQARGSHDIDTRADIYSLGATMFHLLTGETPYQGNTSAAIIVKHIKEPVPSAHERCPEVSETASAVAARMMQKDPAERYQTPAEVRDEIDRLLAGKAPRHASGLQARIPSVRLSRAAASFRKPGGSSDAVRYIGYGVGVLVFLITLVFILKTVFPDPPLPDPHDIPPLVTDPQPHVPADDPALLAWERAGGFEIGGRLEEARDAFAAVAEEFPESPYAQPALEKVQELTRILQAGRAPEPAHPQPPRPDRPGRHGRTDRPDRPAEDEREIAAREALRELRRQQLPPAERLALLDAFVQEYAGTQTATRTQREIEHIRQRLDQRGAQEMERTMQERRVASLKAVLEGRDEARILASLPAFEMDPRALQPLAGQMRNLIEHASDAAVREGMLRVLVGVDREAGAEAVRGRLHDRNERVRLAAVELAKEHRLHAAQRDFSRLKENDPSPRVRAAVE